jgi:hypothetical protein
VRALAVLALLCSSGCAHAPLAWMVGNDKPPHVLCHALEGCPSDEELREALTQAAFYLPGFDPKAPLTVEWHADGEVFGQVGETRFVALTKSPSHVVVSSWRLLGHELVHVHLWRATGSPDHAHRHPLWGELEAALKDDLDG